MNLITLKDLRAQRLTYNWETIYVGMEMGILPFKLFQITLLN